MEDCVELEHAFSLVRTEARLDYRIQISETEKKDFSVLQVIE